jgi:hypothetical protein
MDRAQVRRRDARRYAQQMTTMRGVGQRQGGGAGAGGAGAGHQRTVDVRQLDAESQRAHELLKALTDIGDVAGRRLVLSRAGTTEPLTPKALAAVATLMARLDMPLTPAGIARFKAERAVVGGSALAGAVARAYVRAVEGGEVLFRLDRKEELELRPGDRAALDFLRQLARSAGAEAVGRLKEALNLGNPPAATPEAAALMNEYVGAATVRELAHATTVANVPLTSDAVKAFVAQLEDKKQAAADAAAKPKITRPSSTKTTTTTTTNMTPAPASTATMTAPPTSTPPTGPGSSVPGRGLRR